MRKGFTLIELMIVIAIIAIIAAIAIPNLLESRVTSQESAAAAALKSGILPAEVQFQAGAYVDDDNDGLGQYASGNQGYNQMAGSSTVGTGITLSLLAPVYQNAGTTAASPTISAYTFFHPATSTLADGAERTWTTATRPQDANSGRRLFLINQAGNVYASTPNANAFSTDPALATVWGASFTASPASATWKPYRR